MHQPWLSIILAMSLILSACQVQPMPVAQQGVPMAVQAATLTIDSQQAIELLGQADEATLSAYRDRLDLYRTGKPYHEP